MTPITPLPSSPPAARPSWRLALAPLLIALAIGVVGVGLVRAQGLGFRREYAQIAWVMIGGVAAGVIAVFVPSRALGRIAFPLYAAAMLAMIAACLQGHQAYHGRFLQIGRGLVIRVAEPMALAMVLAIARARDERFEQPAWLAPGLAFAPLLIALGVSDYGAAMVFVLVAALMLALDGRVRVLLGGAVVSLSLAPVAWSGLHAYQRQRVLAFLRGGGDPHGIGWLPHQLRTMIHDGGLFGARRPLAPRHVFADAELSFAVLGRTYGLVGLFAVLAAFVVLLVLAARIARRAPDVRASLMAGGIAVWLGVKVAIPFALVAGLFPIVSISPPMLGYGGSSVVVSLIACGVLGAIARDGLPRDATIDASRSRRLDRLALALPTIAAVLVAGLAALRG